MLSIENRHPSSLKLRRTSAGFFFICHKKSRRGENNNKFTYTPHPTPHTPYSAPHTPHPLPLYTAIVTPVTHNLPALNLKN